SNASRARSRATGDTFGVAQRFPAFDNRCVKTPARLRLLARFVSLGLLALGAGRLIAAENPVPASAPVPPEVAIARPTSDEIAAAEKSLSRFLAQADTTTRAILAKYPGLLEVRPPRVNPAVVPYMHHGFRTKHAANVEVAQAGDIDVLF